MYLLKKRYSGKAHLYNRQGYSSDSTLGLTAGSGIAWGLSANARPIAH